MRITVNWAENLTKRAGGGWYTARHAVILGVSLAGVFSPVTNPAWAASDVVISQVYGGAEGCRPPSNTTSSSYSTGAAQLLHSLAGQSSMPPPRETPGTRPCLPAPYSPDSTSSSSSPGETGEVWTCPHRTLRGTSPWPPKAAKWPWSTAQPRLPAVPRACLIPGSRIS